MPVLGVSDAAEHRNLTASGESADSGDVLDLDGAVTSGRLDNGLTWFIRRNAKPEGRIELRLAVRAGSVLEDDDQQGLAHFCEHMAFNGTKQFKKNELVDFLESIGMRFGPELNAYTGFDQTVYILQIPSDNDEVVDKSFRILQDWAQGVLYENEAIDRERGVILEEWRLGRGASARIRDKQFPVLFDGSRYASRMPIGKKEIIEGAPHDALRRFYRDWYRPDLMAVIVVGDVDVPEMERLITDYFSGLTMPDNPRERVIYPVPDHKETLYAVTTDPEATGSSVSIYWKRDVSPSGTENDYRRDIVSALFNAMLNDRLDELRRKPDPPFLGAQSGQGRFVLSKEVYMLYADVRDNGVERGFETILTEGERVRRYGFTETELERAKTALMRSMELAYNERDKTESTVYANEYVRHFLMDEPAPGIEREYDMYRRFLPGITIGEVNRLADEWITGDNRVILVDGPEKEGVSLPDETSLAAVIDKVSSGIIKPYVDDVTDEPLVSTPPKPSAVESEMYIEEIGVTEWTLANGIRVVLKPTDFKNDEVLFTAFSFGGTSLVPDSLFVSASTATSIVGESGIGAFDLTGLNKKLTGKVVSVSPYIGDEREGFSGSASPSDLETMFQLIYLYAASPRRDSEAFESFRSRMLGFVENRSARPEMAFSDTLMAAITQYNHRSRPWTKALIDEIDESAAFDIYRDRFADMGDFTFLFVGAFEPERMRPLVETWIGGLPVTGRVETWNDSGVRFPGGIVDKTVRKGIEPKSMVAMVFNGPFEWNRRERYVAGSMVDALRIKLREVLREDMGGTYGVRVQISVTRYPREEYTMLINFGASPDRVEELTSTVFTQLDSLRTTGTTDVYLNKVKESQRREREVNLKINSYWLNALESYYYNEDDPRLIARYEELVDSLTLDDIRHAAVRLLDTSNYVRIVLYPENNDQKQ